MGYPENRLIVGSALATVTVLLILGLAEARLGIFGEWVYVLAFSIWVLVGYVLPQYLLIRWDHSTPRLSRLGVITLLLLVVASMFSANVSGLALQVLWGLVFVSIGGIFAHEAVAGYQEHTPTEI